jgi:hypothetical protein
MNFLTVSMLITMDLQITIYSQQMVSLSYTVVPNFMDLVSVVH